MYLKHYNLKTSPFDTNHDPKFIWVGEKLKEALATLKSGIQEDKGFLLLTGDIGSGKTTLVKYFINKSVGDAIMMSLPDPDLRIKDFFRLLSNEFNANIDFKTRGEFLLKFKGFLDHSFSNQKKVLMVIDEAQRLNQQLLEQVRLLSNIERQDVKLFSIFLAGQNELHKRLMDDQNRALRERIAVHYHIEPLTEAETRHYINHRLQVAGSQIELFNPEAISEIFLFSKGCPRPINTICDRALLTGYASGISQIDRKLVQKCIDEFALPGEKKYALETARLKPDTEVRKENNREAAEEVAEAKVNKGKNNCESADTEPGAEAGRDAKSEAAQQEPAVKANENKPLTWGPGAEPKALRVRVNDQELPSKDKLMPAPRIMMTTLAILILTAVALYVLLGA